MVAELLEREASFKLDDLGEEVFRRSYAADENETWELASHRVAEHVAAAEDGDKRLMIKNIIFFVRHVSI